MTDGLIDAARAQLIKREGRRTRVYSDSKGIPTIGVGFNLLQPGARDICAQCGADYDALLTGDRSLTLEQCDQILTYFIIENVEWLGRIFPSFHDYSIKRQVALIDLSFMGEGSFRTFRHMIDAVLHDNWTMAAAEVMDSKWAHDVGPERANDVALKLAEG